MADKRFNLQTKEHKNSKTMWYCEACEKDINIITKSSPVESAAHIEKEVISKINNNLTDKIYTYINPDFEKVDNLFKGTIDECTHHFHRFKYKCEFDIEFNHATNGNTNYFYVNKKVQKSTRRIK